MNAEIVVVSGSYGAGHDAVADALSQQLRSRGHVVRRLDVAEELPWRIGVLLRWLYFIQLRFLPGSWGTTLRCLEREGWAFHAVRRGLGLLGRRLAREVADAGLVVSTHPFASQALGEARARGVIDTPVVTYLTDASVHRLWVHPAVELHLAIHEVTACQARNLDGTAMVVRPVVASSAGVIPAGWLPPWPLDRPAALVVGGSCGVGELEASALDVLATGLMTPVVACGTNDRLREHLRSIPGVVALGWRDDMTALVAAASCVLQNAGGMTSLESLAAGTPTLTYRPIPGHGTTNAAALDAAGLVPWIPDASLLEIALTRVLVSPGSFALPEDAPTALDVLSRHLRVEPRPVLVAA
ncbi:MAG: processive 1,2-diacylglycerol beta-glucosyltransferase [Nocardioidaceae bacterium]|nr:processive 1,2-diacylglycerol beta-glucosyltransferase [Nocardioidaceae bacterium]